MNVDRNLCVPNSLSVPSRAKFVAKIKKSEELREINEFAKRLKLPLLVLGEGTNILPRKIVRAVVAIMKMKGVRLIRNRLIAKAGEKWDRVVGFAIKKGLSGIEPLSKIPGTVGGAVVQNIGAYGTEISRILEKVEVYDQKNNRVLILKNKDCQFGYRESLFKKHPGRFIVISAILKLSRRRPAMPKYKDVIDYFKNKKQPPSLTEINRAIAIIRKKKLPDYKVLPNAGSFFTNPVVSKKVALRIKRKFPEVPLFVFGEKMKIPAGWLIEKTGLKGAKIWKVEIFSKNALVLTNPQRSDFNEIKKAENLIKRKVFQKFGVTLKREVVII